MCTRRPATIGGDLAALLVGTAMLGGATLFPDATRAEASGSIHLKL